MQMHLTLLQKGHADFEKIIALLLFKFNIGLIASSTVDAGGRRGARGR
jgi:hypothetical protein